MLKQFLFTKAQVTYTHSSDIIEGAAFLWMCVPVTVTERTQLTICSYFWVSEHV